MQSHFYKTPTTVVVEEFPLNHHAWISFETSGDSGIGEGVKVGLEFETTDNPEAMAVIAAFLNANNPKLFVIKTTGSLNDQPGTSATQSPASGA